MKILHITDFHHRHDSRLFYSTARKISNGLVKNNYFVSEISERDSSRNLLNYRKIDNIIKKSIYNLNPDLIIIAHSSKISLETLQFIKKNNKHLKIIQWFVDSLTKKGPDFFHNSKTFIRYIEHLDHSFITTSLDVLDFDNKLKKKISYIPNPSDDSIDNLKLDQNNNQIFDLFFAMSHGQHRGILKKNFIDHREFFLKKIIDKNPNIIFDLYGFNKENPIWGNNFFNKLSQSKMALNLSRGRSVKYYSSDRISSLISNGITTFIDRKTELDDFFNDNEVVFYNNINDFSESLNFLKNNDKKRKEIGRNGRLKYKKYFNNKTVTRFMVEKTFNIKFSENYYWLK
jgi:hypothetical protein